VNIQRLILWRHWVPWGTLAVIVLLPFTGLLRVDVGLGYVLVAGYQVWFDDYYLMLGAVGVAFFAASALFYPLGQSFCGWMCPQHTVSELLRGVIQRLLGRNVLAGFNPEREAGGMKAHSPLARFAGWTMFAVLVVAISAVAAVTILHYFYPTSELLERLSGVTGDKLFWGFLLVIGWLFALDFGFFRHFWCKYMCAFGLYQYLFRGRDTLRIRFDDTRQDDCQRCTLCQDVCPVDLDPRQPEIFTRCINCGICIDACESYLGRFDKKRLLSFGFGSQDGKLIRIESSASPVRNPRLLWPLLGVVVSACLLVVGVMNFSPLKLTLQQGRVVPGSAGVSYGIEVANKGVDLARYSVRVTGLPEAQVTLGRAQLELGVGEHTRVPIQVRQEGLERNRPYPFEVVLTHLSNGVEYREFGTYFMPSR